MAADALLVSLLPCSSSPWYFYEEFLEYTAEIYCGLAASFIWNEVGGINLEALLEKKYLFFV